MENAQANNQAERLSEEKRLEETLALATKQLTLARAAAEKKKTEILEAKREVYENTEHAIPNLWSADGFEALAELSQYTNPVTEKIADYEEEERRIHHLEALLKSPYFARIDFRFDGDGEAEKIYIGRASLKENHCQEMHVYDWRSPIASVFYRFMAGNAFYDAPAGRITGELCLKRQYEIKNGKLEYFFDSDVQVMDDILRQLLSQNASNTMKSIVETIQQDQDIVIRDIENDLLMVQGVAGSGKTSIALHRAAWLMYQGLQTKLTADHIMILSPNDVFEQYISDVLPELGEENVVTAVFDDILQMLLKDQVIQPKNDFMEHLVADSPNRSLLKSSIAFKTSEEFLDIADCFLSAGQKSGAADAVTLYRKIIEDIAASAPSEDIRKICAYTVENLEESCLHYDDAIAAAYLALKLAGISEYRHIRHVIIDEAQDYYPLQYEIFRLLFPAAGFTILGDMNQTIIKKEDLSFYDQVQSILQRKKASLIALNKSFRCTGEILNYSLQFTDQSCEIECFNRRGDSPKILTADDSEGLAEMIDAEVNLCRQKGFQSIALICKTAANCEKLYQKIRSGTDATLIQSDSISDLRGAFIIPVYMSKGLEFDAVLICDANGKNYRDEDDRNLLYVACTRALHRLTLFGETADPLPDVCFSSQR